MCDMCWADWDDDDDYYELEDEYCWCCLEDVVDCICTEDCDDDDGGL